MGIAFLGSTPGLFGLLSTLFRILSLSHGDSCGTVADAGDWCLFALSEVSPFTALDVSTGRSVCEPFEVDLCIGNPEVVCALGYAAIPESAEGIVVDSPASLLLMGVDARLFLAAVPSRCCVFAALRTESGGRPSGLVLRDACDCLKAPDLNCRR